MYVSVTLIGAISISVICVSIISAGVMRNGAVSILCVTSRSYGAANSAIAIGAE